MAVPEVEGGPALKRRRIEDPHQATAHAAYPKLHQLPLDKIIELLMSNMENLPDVLPKHIDPKAPIECDAPPPPEPEDAGDRADAGSGSSSGIGSNRSTLTRQS